MFKIMENQKNPKTIIHTLFLFILIIVIIAMAIYIYTVKTKSDNEIKSLGTNISDMKSTISELQDQLNSDSTSNVEGTDKSNSESQNNMSTELAYGILNKYKNENLPDANWFIKKVELIAHGDNNTYLVSYEDYNLDGNYTESAGTIIEYKDGNWTTDLPGFSGISDEIINKYNFVNY